MKYEQFKELTKEQKEEYIFKFGKSGFPLVYLAASPWVIYFLSLTVISSYLGINYTYPLSFCIAYACTPFFFLIYERYKQKKWLLDVIKREE